MNLNQTPPATCTWLGCRDPAVQSREGRDGIGWAHLCQPHANEVRFAMVSCDITRIGRAWVLAQGGLGQVKL